MKAIDRLLARSEYIDHWSLKWGDLLQNSRNSLSPQSVFLFREWLRGAVASNMPLDEFARQLLTAQGGMLALAGGDSDAESGVQPAAGMAAEEGRIFHRLASALRDFSSGLPSLRRVWRA